jgi:transcriptional regulator with XRE-family HTH domain
LPFVKYFVHFVMENKDSDSGNQVQEGGDFSAWLKAEVAGRGWSLRELGRRSGLSGAAVSAVAQGSQKPGLRFCVRVAGALHLPPEDVLRRAGLLPPLPPPVREEQEAVVLLRRLTPESRGAVLMQLRAMTASQAPAAGDDQPARTAAEADEQLEEQLLEEFRHLPDEWQAAAIEEIERLQRLSQIRPRVIGDEEDGQTDAI